MISTHFSNGDIILESQANDVEFEFENEGCLFSHVLEHIIALHNRERWDDLDIIPRNDLHKILKNELIQQIINVCVLPSSVSRNLPVNRVKKHRKPYEVNLDALEEFDEARSIDIAFSERSRPKEFIILQSIPQFTDLAMRYQKTLSNFLRECCYNIYPHFHVLKYKKRDDGEKFVQVIKALDAQTGILIVANAPYMYNPNSQIIYKNRNQYVIVSGYRFWRSKTPEERMKKFNRSQKELYALELYHDREYQKVLDIQKHFPEEESESSGIGE